jgi:hypothetical protein
MCWATASSAAMDCGFHQTSPPLNGGWVQPPDAENLWIFKGEVTELRCNFDTLKEAVRAYLSR